MSFDRLGLTPELVRAVADQGYAHPTPVQAAAIPFVLAGRDLLAGAQTGTGKTAAFVLPILQRLNADAPRQPDRRDPARRHVRALVLVPTRELAVQVEESVRTYGARRPVRSIAVYGGVGFGPQASALRAGAQVVVATPGRLLDHANQHTIDLSGVEVLVLDEADRMLDMGFIRDIRRILALLPARRQNLLFSATFSDEVRELAAGFLERPAEVDAGARNSAAELVSHLVHPVDRERKRELLSSLVRGGRLDQALVFTRTKHGANRLAEQLARDGIATAAIHGNKGQSQRTRALADFKAGRVTLLVATDLAARGLDVEALPHVVNFELPLVPEDYVHRIGRTGRAGLDGQAISLVCVDEAPLLRDIERLLRHPIPVETIAGFEPDRSIRPEPIRLRSAEHRVARPARRGADAGAARFDRRPSPAFEAGAYPPSRPARTAAAAFGRGWRPGHPGDAGRPGAAGQAERQPRGARPAGVGSDGIPARGVGIGQGPRSARPATQPGGRRPAGSLPAARLAPRGPGQPGERDPRFAPLPGERFASRRAPGSEARPSR